MQNYKTPKMRESLGDLGHVCDVLDATPKALSMKEMLGWPPWLLKASALWKEPLGEWEDKPYSRRKYL